VIALSVELDRIKAIDSFATGLHAQAIEAVIEGDWRLAADHAEWCKFDEEHEDLRARCAPIWEGYRAILIGAVEDARRRAAGIPVVKS